MALIDDLGGPAKLRRIIADFVDRICDDLLIGFFFDRADRERLKEMEFKFAGSHLGLPVVYDGRPLKDVHAEHPIKGGHFARRQKILQEVLEDHGVPAHVATHWLSTNEKLRPLITDDEGGECGPRASR